MHVCVCVCVCVIYVCVYAGMHVIICMYVCMYSEIYREYMYRQSLTDCVSKHATDVWVEGLDMRTHRVSGSSAFKSKT